MLTKKEREMIDTMLDMMRNPVTIGQDICVTTKDVKELLDQFVEPKTGGGIYA